MFGIVAEQESWEGKEKRVELGKASENCVCFEFFRCGSGLDRDLGELVA